MIGYATIGSNDPERAHAFYDAVLAPLGGKRVFANERLQFWASRQMPGMIAVGTPFEGEASVGNGAMFGLAAPTRDVVDEVYAAAIAAGAKCEGAPGQRTERFYGAYFRDLEGNKLCAYKLG